MGHSGATRIRRSVHTVPRGTELAEHSVRGVRADFEHYRVRDRAETQPDGQPDRNYSMSDRGSDRGETAHTRRVYLLRSGRRAGLLLSSVVIAARPSRVCTVILCAAVLLLAAATPAGFGFIFAATAAFGTILIAPLCRVFRAAPENPGAIGRHAFRSPLSGRAPPLVS